MPKGKKSAVPAKRKAKEENEDKEEVEEEEEETLAKTKAKPKKKAAKKQQKEEEEEGEGEEGGEATKETTPAKATDFSVPVLAANQLKISSWNIAGFSSILKKGFVDYVKNENPDILCIQETKIRPNGVKSDLVPGYHQHFLAAQKNGYSGTAIFSKVKPVAITEGIGIADHDEEGRVITAEYDGFYIINTYIPNSGRKLVDLDYRQKWDKDFLEYMKKLDAKKPVIWCGDLNVAHKEIDLKNPGPNKNKTAGFSDQEREGFTKVLEAGFVDAFRHLYPNEKDCFTFWSFMRNARANNIGWRLDYFVISKRILDKLGDCYRRPDVMGSDHCPLVLHIALK